MKYVFDPKILHEVALAHLELPLETEAWVRRVANRLPAERWHLKDRSTDGVNGGLKDEFSGRRIRGQVNVMAHLMFDICVLSDDQLIHLLHCARLPLHRRPPAPGTGPMNRSTEHCQRRADPGRKPASRQAVGRTDGRSGLSRPPPQGNRHFTRNCQVFYKSALQQ